MPGRWVVRKDVNGVDVAGPLPCYVANAIIAEKGVRTVEQCIQDLLLEGEITRGEGDHLQIIKGSVVTGLIEITKRAL